MIPGLKFTLGGGRGGRRGGRRSSRIRRVGRSAAQLGRRRFGQGGTQEERVRDIVREGVTNLFRRRGRG